MSFQYLRIILDLTKLYFEDTQRHFGIEVYLYTSGNIIIPRETTGAFGSTVMKFNKPKENTSIIEKYFWYKNMMKSHASTGLAVLKMRQKILLQDALLRGWKR